MHSKVVFITTGHSPFDDRIYYHQAASLSLKSIEVYVLSSMMEIVNNDNNIHIIAFDGNELSKTEKLNRFVDLLFNINPNCIICSEPLAIIAAHNYKKKNNSKANIIYDVTEWYPSKKNLVNQKGIEKIGRFFKLLFFNIYASLHANSFIFGEYYKGIPYKIVFPFKKSIIISYYPDLKYIDYKKKKYIENKICLGYTGEISKDKGCFNFINVVKQLNKMEPNLEIELKIIGWFPSKIEEAQFTNELNKLKTLKVSILGYQKFIEFSKELYDIDVLFDLRELNFEYSYSLPIKLFYYICLTIKSL